MNNIIYVANDGLKRKLTIDMLILMDAETVLKQMIKDGENQRKTFRFGTVGGYFKTFKNMDEETFKNDFADKGIPDNVLKEVFSTKIYNKYKQK